MTTGVATAGSPTDAPWPRRFNARDVLPPDLIEQVQSHVSAAYLWIPSSEMVERRQRADRVSGLRTGGMKIREIAAEVGLTERRVQQILRDRREAQRVEAVG